MLVKPQHPDELVSQLKSKSLIIYGMGDTGKRIAKWCDEHSISYLWSDKATDKLEKVTARRAVAPNKISHDYPEAHIVVASILYQKEMTQDLLSLGVGYDQIIQPDIFMPEQVTWRMLEENDCTSWTAMYQRIERISSWGWISGNETSVADYGAGRKLIKYFLSDSTIYYPIDYIDRGVDTIICDFNKKEFPCVQSELSVCLGVLMLIEPSIELLEHICKHTEKTIIFSYITLENLSDTDTRVKMGMCQNYTEQQIIDIFNQYSYMIKDKRLYICKNSSVPMTFFLLERRSQRLDET